MLDAAAFKKPPRQCIVVAALVLLFLVLNIAILAGAGVRMGSDTPRYLSGANNLLTGQSLVDKQSSYMGYVAVVALLQAIGLGFNGIMTFQLLVASLAIVALYDLGRRLGGQRAGVIAAGLLIADLSIARWHFYLLTDSLYSSAVVLATWAVIWAAERPGYRYILAAAIVLVTASLRPHGWLFLPISGIYWVWTGISNRHWRWVGMGAVIVLFAVGVALSGRLRAGIAEESLGTMFSQGEVVWGYAPWRLPMPAGLSPQAGLADVLAYGAHNPLPVLRLMGARLLADFANVRPYYSSAHNVLVLAWLLPVYLLAVAAIFRLRRTPAAWLIVSIIAGHAAAVALTFADWDGRFLLYVLPLCYLLCACAVAGWGRLSSATLRYGLITLFLAGLITLAVMRGAEEYSPRKTALIIGGLPADTVQRGDVFSGQLRLLGFAPLVTDHQPGHYAEITLYWQSLAPAPEDYSVTIQMLSPSGERIAWADQEIGSASYPMLGTSIWPVGTRLSEAYSLHVPEDAPPVLDIYVSVYSSATGERLRLAAPDGTLTGEDRVWLGRLGLLTSEGLPALEGAIDEVDYRLGKTLSVTGLSLPRRVVPSGDLAVGVRIEATQPIYENDILFFHLLNQTGQTIAQSDSPVLAGDWTTAALIPGYPLGAIRLIDLPDDLPAGEYRLIMGMYAYPSLDRLTVRNAQGDLLPDGLIDVGLVDVLRK